ncbi:MAG TPA: acetyl-CoA carboxylase biotin carboxyl carrier protein [Chitinophagaceae bacterium]|nr:acetyl-CoA carboxylase biotin carboxyl carrier protein [Chitinophagaceae bacterium]
MATSKKAAPKKAQVKKAVPQKVAASKNATKAPVVSSKGDSKSPAPIFNIEEINDILKAVHLSNVNELKLEKGDFKITIRQGVVVSAPTQVVHAAAPTHAPAPVATAAPIAAPAPSAPAAAPAIDENANLITIKSPMIGTFYRSSGPGKPVFVNVGDEIKVGQVLCIVEAMKLFNEIESEVSGKIVKVLVDDTSPVEYDQPLFLVQPS